MKNRHRKALADIFAPAQALAVAFVLVVAASLGGCARTEARPLIDRAFAVLYPELAAAEMKALGAKKGTDAGASAVAGDDYSYLPLPTQSQRFDIGAEEIAVASPAVVEALQSAAKQTKTRIVSLLVPASGFSSVSWDSEWAYRQAGLVAGYRTALLRRTTAPGATAGILFARGIGRSDAELSAFEAGFAQGGAEISLLSVFDVDAMGLRGDRLEQTLAACSQMLERGPGVVAVAAGSRSALEKALGARSEIIADLRGLGPYRLKEKILFGIEENAPALVRAVSSAVRALHAPEAGPLAIRVPPALSLSSEARRALSGSLQKR